MPDVIQPNLQRETPPPEPETHEWHFVDLLSVLYRRRWASIVTFLIVAAALATYTLKATPIYEARSPLLVADKPDLVTFQGAPAQSNSSFETHQRLLRSRSLAKAVVDELDLWEAPTSAPMAPAVPAPPPSRVARWWESARRWAGWTDPVSTANADEAPVQDASNGSTETQAESRAIGRLLSNLSVTPVRNTGILEVRYESPDPVLAATVVNTLTKAYITQDLELRSHASTEASAWLTQQLAEQRRKMQAAELALQRFRERGGNLALDSGQNIVVQRLDSVNSAATQARTDRMAAEALYRQLVESQNDADVFDALPPIRSSGAVHQARTRLANLQFERTELSRSLGAKHPEMVRVDAAIEAAETELSAEIAKTVESVRQDYLAALAREEELTSALEAQKASVLSLNRQSIEHGVLLRDVESNRQIYQSLLQRANETAVSSELKHTNIEVVDAAEVPRAPVRPDTRSNLLIGLLLGTVLAVAMAFILEVADSRIQTPADVKSALRIPFLGMLPDVSARALNGNAPLLGNGVPVVYAEACRFVRTNILAAAGTGGSRSLLVTSAAPGDGKSSVAVNLAMTLGRSGAKVLIVDADLRRPILHELLERKQRPGLSEVISGRRKPSEAIIATRCAGLWLLPAGLCPQNPSELLGSKRFEELLKQLCGYFDWVIIDSPPVMAVTDPAVIAHLTNGVLFVVNARRTKRRVAQAALDRLETAGATFAGAVLNAIALDRDYYYDASYYLPFYGDYLSDSRTA
jgi:capsular exopolysaccharide synthesis family protein